MYVLARNFITTNTLDEVSSISVDLSKTFLAAATCALLLSSRRSALRSAVSLASSTIPPPNSVKALTNSAKLDTDSNRSRDRATCSQSDNFQFTYKSLASR